ncbi:MAG: TonB family protein, partial [Crocinitomicaceae bacterium]
ALVSISLSASAQEQNTGTINTPPAVHQEKTRGMVQVAKPGTIEPLDTLKCVEVPLKPEPLIEVLGGAPVLVIEPDMIEGGITHMADSRIKVYESGILPYADKMPEYCGGIDALYEFIEENINYPKWELKKSIHGNVYVRFIVNADGTLRDAQILNSIPNSKNIDAEVLRLISIMPDWEAGENQGAKTPVYMTIPITFHLK